MDPPRHTRVRSLIAHAFHARSVAALEPRIRQLAEQLLDAVSGKSNIELVDDFAYDLPVTVIAEMMGFPASDRAVLKDSVEELLSSTEAASLLPPGPERTALLKRMLVNDARIMDYVRQHVVDRRRRPREDMLTGLLHADIEGDRLDDDEIVNFVSIVLLAGHITTTMLLGNTVVCLSARPDETMRIRADRSLVPGAIEESLRLMSPFASVGRVTTRDVVLGSVTIPARQPVAVWLGSGNRDPLAFSDPHSFRPARRPNPHLAFGRGAHFCPGAALARLEGRIAVNLLLDRIPTLGDRPLQGVQFNRNPNTTGVQRLPLQIDGSGGAP
jgi:cytochrome P450